MVNYHVRHARSFVYLKNENEIRLYLFWTLKSFFFQMVPNIIVENYRVRLFIFGIFLIFFLFITFGDRNATKKRKRKNIGTPSSSLENGRTLYDNLS